MTSTTDTGTTTGTTTTLTDTSTTVAGPNRLSDKPKVKRNRKPKATPAPAQVSEQEAAYLLATLGGAPKPAPAPVTKLPTNGGKRLPWVDLPADPSKGCKLPKAGRPTRPTMVCAMLLIEQGATLAELDAAMATVQVGDNWHDAAGILRFLNRRDGLGFVTVPGTDRLRLVVA